MISDTRHLNGRLVASTDVDNNTADVTVPGREGVQHHLAEIIADYSAAPAAGFKAVTVQYQGVTVAIFRWDPTKEMPFRLPLGADVHASYNQNLTVLLAPSGTGGVTGRVSIVTYSK